MKCIDIEVRLANHFGYVKNIIVPNVSFGLFTHELDLAILWPSGWCDEVEIKISKSDLLKDQSKGHKHSDFQNKIRYLYFAVPDNLKDIAIQSIPEHAGLISLKEESNGRGAFWITVEHVRNPEKQFNSRKLTDKERYKLARLGSIRVWPLKEKEKNRILKQAKLL